MGTGNRQGTWGAQVFHCPTSRWWCYFRWLSNC